MQPLSNFTSHPDAQVAQAADDFDARFRQMLDALRLEAAAFGEAATIGRVLDSGCALERGALLTALGHCKKVVVKVTSPDDEGALAWDARAVAFLKGLLAGEPLSVETLRPLRPVVEDTDDEDLAMFSAENPHDTPQLVDQREAP